MKLGIRWIIIRGSDQVAVLVENSFSRDLHPGSLVTIGNGKAIFCGDPFISETNGLTAVFQKLQID